MTAISETPPRFAVFDRFGNFKHDLTGIESAVWTREVNGTDELSVSGTFTAEKGERFVWRDKTGAWHEHMVSNVTQTHDTTTAWLESSIGELRLDYIVDKRPSGSARVGMTAALSSSRWDVGTVDVAGSASASLYHVSAFEALQQVVKAWGGEVVASITVTPGSGVTGRAVDLLTHVGNTEATRRFDYSADLLDISKTVLDDDIITACYAWGKGEQLESGTYGRRIGISSVSPGGLPYVYDDTANALYGRGDGGYSYGSVTYDDVTDPVELLQLARKYLDEHSSPAITYSASVLQFGEAGADLRGVSVGDEVQVVDSEFPEPLRLSARAVRIEQDLIDPNNSVITLGTITPTISSSVSGLKAQVRSLSNRSAGWDAVELASTTYINNLVANLNDLFATSGGFVTIDTATGITVTDRATPETSTMAINISGAGFRIANSKTSGGDWNWRTFGTGAGFTSDEIVTGTLKAGLIEDVTGENYWNLDTGEFQLKAMDDLYIGGTNLLMDSNAPTLAKFAADGDRYFSSSSVTTVAPSWPSALVTPPVTGLKYAARYTVSAGDGTKGRGLCFYVDHGVYLVPGETYTLSFYARLPSGSTSAKIRSGYGVDSYKYSPYVTIDNHTWQQYSWTFVYDDSVISASTGYVGPRIYAGIVYDQTAGTVFTCGYKLEQGNRATSWRPNPNDLNAEALSYTELLDESLNQQAVFNRLTNNGVTQGIYLENGKVYINGTYIQAGTINGALVKANSIDAETVLTGTIRDAANLNYWNLETGAFSLQSGATVGGDSIATGTQITTLNGSISAAQAYATAKYGTSSTAAGTAAKVVSCSNFKLFTGASVTVRFSTANTTAAPTLNVNSTGAAPIWVDNAVTSASNPLLWSANSILTFVYDGTRWRFVGEPGSYALTSSTAAGTAAKTATQAGVVIINGTAVAVTFSAANSANAPTLNVGSTGAAAVWYNNAVTSASNKRLWAAGASILFVRKGATWVISDGDIQSLVDVLDDSLTQESVFNRLTNNGETQGIFLNQTDKKLYINANYIAAGTLSANYISGGTIDASDVTITNLDADNITAGTISAANGASTWNLSTGVFKTLKSIQAGGTITSGSTYASGATTLSNARLRFYSSDGWAPPIPVDDPDYDTDTGVVHGYIYVPVSWQTDEAGIGRSGRPLLIWSKYGTQIGGAPLYVNNQNVTIIEPGIDSDGSTPSSTAYSQAYEIVDKNGTRIAHFQGVYGSSGRIGARFGGQRQINGSAVANILGLYVDASGNPVVAVTDAAAWRSALGTGNADNLTSGTVAAARLPTVPISKGGTNATTAGAALQNLGIVYKPGDEISGSCHVGGYVTNAKKTHQFSIPLRKPISGSVTCVKMDVTCRQGGNYILGSDSATWNALANSTLTTAASAGVINVKIVLSTAVTSATNNDSAGYYVSYSFLVS